MKLTDLPISTPLVEVTVQDSDWAAQPSSDLLWMLQQMLLIRHFEQRLLAMKGKDLIHGPVHTSIGQEAVAAGMGCALRPGDRITGTHRAHHQYLAKALGACRPAGHDPLRDGLTAPMRQEIVVLLSEIMGLDQGCSRGRGGSMHLVNPEAGILGTNAIVAGGVPHATGAAWADRMTGRDAVTVCFFGDGALYQGVLDESSNLASLWKAPVIYFIENNQYAVGTKLSQSCSAKALHEKAVAYGMVGMRLDGMDPMAVKLGLAALIERRGSGWLPAYVDAQTYRYLHHAGDLAGSAFGYRPKEEEAAWRSRDPIDRTVLQLRRLKLLDDKALEAMTAEITAAIDAAERACTDTAADGRPRVRPALWPAPSSAAEHLRDEAAWRDVHFVEAEQVQCQRTMKYSDAIAAVTGHWLAKDPRTFVCGEEVANLGGGAYGGTKGLHQLHPQRVLNTPISESGFSGLACGAAMAGMHPIVEIMFSSFVLVAADQLFNQIAQLRHIYGGRVPMPLVVRTRIALGLGYGAQHSLDPAAIFALFPGYRIFCPTTPFDYIGLFNAAMLAQSPTVMIEHHEFYGRKGPVPEDLDYVVRPGSAKVLRSGRHVTAATYGWGVLPTMAAAESLAQEGIEVEVVDLRTLDDAGMDWATLGQSLSRTRMLVTVEQAPACNSIGGKIIAGCVKRFFDELDGAPLAVAGPNVPIPVSRSLETGCIPSVQQVAEALRRAARHEV